MKRRFIMVHPAIWMRPCFFILPVWILLWPAAQTRVSRMPLVALSRGGWIARSCSLCHHLSPKKSYLNCHALSIFKSYHVLRLLVSSPFCCITRLDSVDCLWLLSGFRFCIPSSSFCLPAQHKRQASTSIHKHPSLVCGFCSRGAQRLPFSQRLCHTLLPAALVWFLFAMQASESLQNIPEYPRHKNIQK